MSITSFSRPHRIRFSECDPAGIVFYPQYFIMFNDLLEQWFDVLLPTGFAGFIGEQGFGLPTVHLEADFKAVSRMGDDVTLQLEVIHIGSRSLKLALSCISLQGELRMQVIQTLVTTSLETHRAIYIPTDLLEALRASGGEQ